MFDYRGNPPHAKLILLPDQPQVGRLVKPNIVYEQPMIPFTGLTTDMRGRDLLRYAICKYFSTNTYEIEFDTTFSESSATSRAISTTET